jgi:hypothetical protein
LPKARSSLVLWLAAGLLAARGLPALGLLADQIGLLFITVL